MSKEQIPLFIPEDINRSFSGETNIDQEWINYVDKYKSKMGRHLGGTYTERMNAGIELYEHNLGVLKPVLDYQNTWIWTRILNRLIMDTYMTDAYVYKGKCLRRLYDLSDQSDKVKNLMEGTIHMFSGSECLQGFVTANKISDKTFYTFTKRSDLLILTALNNLTMCKPITDLDTLYLTSKIFTPVMLELNPVMDYRFISITATLNEHFDSFISEFSKANNNLLINMACMLRVADLNAELVDGTSFDDDIASKIKPWFKQHYPVEYASFETLNNLGLSISDICTSLVSKNTIEPEHLERLEF